MNLKQNNKYKDERRRFDRARLGWTKTTGAIGTHALVNEMVLNLMRKSETFQ